MAMENGPEMKMYFLLKIEIFRCYLSLPEGIPKELLSPRPVDLPPFNPGMSGDPRKKKPTKASKV